MWANFDIELNCTKKTQPSQTLSGTHFFLFEIKQPSMIIKKSVALCNDVNTTESLNEKFISLKIDYSGSKVIT